MNDLSQIKSKSQIKLNTKADGAEKIYEDDEWLVYHIKTVEASVLLGKGTKWCISATDENYFNSYAEDNTTFYFFISKKLPQTNKNYKIAAAVYENDVIEYFDAADNEIYNVSFLPNIKLNSIIPDFRIEDAVLTKLNNKSLKKAIIPDGVQAIGICAFEQCDKLTSVIIPNSVIEIGDSAFDDCTSLKSVILPDSLKEIKSATFYNCTALSSIKLPMFVKKIGKEAFYNCESLTSIIFSNSVKEIGDSAFAMCESLSSIVLPSSVERIGIYAFASCIALKSIVIPKSVEFIGRAAFRDCASLTTVKVLNPKCKIYEEAFKNCPNVKIEIAKLNESKRVMLSEDLFENI